MRQTPPGWKHPGRNLQPSRIGYILARGYDGPFGQFYAKAGERGWWREELACGHDVMLDMPNELAALLQQRR